MSGRKKLIQKQFLKLIDRLPGAVFQYQQWADGRSRFPYASNVIEKILFVSPKALAKKGHLAWEQVCPDYRPLLDETLVRSMKNEDEFEITFCIQPPQKDIMWIRMHAIAENQSDGSTVWHGHMEDITRWQKERLEAERHTALLRAIFDNLEDQFYYMDRESRILGVNQACCQYHGKKSEKELIGKTDIDLYPDELGIKMYEEEQQLMTSGKTYREKERHILSNGQVSYLESIKCPLKNSSGDIIGLAAISRDITDQVKNEQALLAAKKKAENNANILRTIFDNIEDHVYYKDRSSKVIGGNPSWVKSRGVESIEELVGKTDIEIHPAPMGQHLFENEQDLMAEKRSIRERERHVRPDGTVQYFDSVKCPVINKNGEVTGLVGISRDVTLEEHQKEALIAAKQRAEENSSLLRAIFDNLPDQIFCKNLDLRIIKANEACRRRHEGIDIIGKTDLDLFPGDVGRQFMADERQQLKTGEVLRKTEELHAPDGATTYLETVKTPAFNKKGEVTGLVGISRDVTEEEKRKQALIAAKQQAEQQADLLRAIFNNITDHFYCKDREGRMVRANKTCFEYHGFSSEQEILGKTDMDLYSDELAHEHFQQEQDLMESGQVDRKRERHQLPDGSTLFLESIKCPIFNEQGEVTGLVGISRDITQQVENEEALVTAKQEAEKANQAKSAFLAMMSHEIRTPMNGVIGAASLLRGTDLTSRQEEFVDTIQVCGENLLTIINDILDYSKIEAGKIELEQEPFVLRECIEEAFDLFVPDAAQKNIELLYDIDRDVPEGLLGDSTRLSQILINLLGNALKFTETGEVSLTVKRLESQEGLCRLELSVRDTGIGIPTEQQDRLFKAFSQADVSSTRKYGGTGLGLVICHRLTGLMGGKIWFESTPGKGSVFFFTIELPEAEITDRPKRDLPVEELKHKRVLIVDDNQTNRTLLAEQLLQWGVFSEAFADPAQALQHLQEGNRYDIALIDFQMPVMDGAELARKIHELPEPLRTPVIILSSSCERIEPHPAISLRLSKPVKINKLRKQMLQLLGTESSSTAGASERPVERRQDPTSILVAEDNPINQRICQLMLQRLGYHNCAFVEDGEAAVKAAAEFRPAIILMDVQMPKMNGIKATKKIRKQSHSDTEPWIIALTAGVMTEEKKQAFAAGMNAFLAKPLSIEQLDSAIERAKKETAS